MKYSLFLFALIIYLSLLFPSYSACLQVARYFDNQCLVQEENGHYYCVKFIDLREGHGIYRYTMVLKNTRYLFDIVPADNQNCKAIVHNQTSTDHEEYLIVKRDGYYMLNNKKYFCPVTNADYLKEEGRDFSLPPF